jgi:polyhydroxyalkanoate synthesis regulator phasin
VTTRTAYGPEPNGTEVAYVKRISWAAVFAGVILALVIQLLLSMLGTGLGMSMVDPVEGETPTAEALSTAAGIWWIVSGLIALLTAGWIAGRLAGIPSRVDGMIHGLLSWGLSTLLLVLFIGTALGALIGGTVNLVGSGVRALAPSVANVAGQMSETDVPWTDIKREAQALLRQTGKPELQPQALEQQARGAAQESGQAAQEAAKDPASGEQELDSLLDRLIGSGKAVTSEVDREAVINVLVTRTDMSQDEAARTVDNWIRTYQETKAKAAQQAREVADKTAETISKSSIWGFIAFLIGGAAAGIGGILGAPRAPVVVPSPRARSAALD